MIYEQWGMNSRKIWAIRPPDKSAYWGNYFRYFSSKTYVVDTQKNRLNETVLLSTQKLIGKKIITILHP